MDSVIRPLPILRLTLGGAPGLHEWGALSEMICDLVMKFLQDDDWDPTMLPIPNPELVTPKETMHDDIPFAEGTYLIVDIPVDPKGVTVIYSDDTVGLAVDIEGSNNTMRLKCAILLDIYVEARPSHPSEIIPQ